MITWTGLGFLAGLLWLVPLTVVWRFTDRTELWPSVLAQAISGSVIWPLGRYLNREATNHLFCGVRFEYWAILFPAISGSVYGFFQLLD